MGNEDVKTGEATAVKQSGVAPPTLAVVTGVRFEALIGPPKLVLTQRSIEAPEGFELIVGEPFETEVDLSGVRDDPMEDR